MLKFRNFLSLLRDERRDSRKGLVTSKLSHGKRRANAEQSLRFNFSRHEMNYYSADNFQIATSMI